MKNYPLEMEYTSQRKMTILDKGRCKGYFYYIISYGTHPCCYVELDKSHPLYGKKFDEMPIYCHGGLTFGEMTDRFCGATHFYIGWDYCHGGDYYAYDYPITDRISLKLKKWTTIEMFSHIQDVVNQLIAIQKQ